MSKDFGKIKSFYDRGLWNKQMVKNAVVKEKITPAEFEEITGESYDNFS